MNHSSSIILHAVALQPCYSVKSKTPEYILIFGHLLQNFLVNSESADFAETALFFSFYFSRAAQSLFRQTINLGG